MNGHFPGQCKFPVFRRLRGAAAGLPRRRADKRGRPRARVGPGGARGARGTRMGIAFIPSKWAFSPEINSLTGLNAQTDAPTLLAVVAAVAFRHLVADRAQLDVGRSRHELLHHPECLVESCLRCLHEHQPQNV